MESLEALLELLTPLARLGRPALAAIDGRCGSGKSTLAGLAAHRLGCPLFHMDDFSFRLPCVHRSVMPLLAATSTMSGWRQSCCAPCGRPVRPASAPLTAAPWTFPPPSGPSSPA